MVLIVPFEAEAGVVIWEVAGLLYGMVTVLEGSRGQIPMTALITLAFVSPELNKLTKTNRQKEIFSAQVQPAAQWTVAEISKTPQSEPRKFESLVQLIY